MRGGLEYGALAGADVDARRGGVAGRVAGAPHVELPRGGGDRSPPSDWADLDARLTAVQLTLGLHVLIARADSARGRGRSRACRWRAGRPCRLTRAWRLALATGTAAPPGLAASRYAWGVGVSMTRGRDSGFLVGLGVVALAVGGGVRPGCSPPRVPESRSRSTGRSWRCRCPGEPGQRLVGPDSHARRCPAGRDAVVAVGDRAVPRGGAPHAVRACQLRWVGASAGGPRPGVPGRGREGTLRLGRRVGADPARGEGRRGRHRVGWQARAGATARWPPRAAPTTPGCRRWQPWRGAPAHHHDPVGLSPPTRSATFRSTTAR